MNNHGNRRRGCGCGCMRMARGYWNNFPYYTGPCPDEDGCYRCGCDNDDDNDRDDDRCDRDDDRRGGRNRRCRRKRHCNGIFTAWLPVAVGANGIVPLAANNSSRESCFEVNSGLITLEKAGTYLAIYTVLIPENERLETVITLNVDGAAQSSATTQVITEERDGTASFTGQAIFEAAEGATVSLRSSECININCPTSQPVFTLSLVQLED